MRRLIAFLALALAVVAPTSAQRAGMSPGFKSGFKYLDAYAPASIAAFAAMSVQPTNARKGQYNQFVTCMQGNNPQGSDVWTGGVWIGLVAAHDAQAGRLNLRTPAQVATANGALTFTTDRGYAGDGSTGYLETGLADNAGGNYTQNSATVAVWINAAPGTSQAVLGQSAATIVTLVPYTGTLLSIRVNHSTGPVNLAVSDGLGLSLGTRNDSANATIYRNLTTATAARASVALTGSTFQIFRASGTFATGRVAAIYIGAGVNSTQEAAIYFCENQYLTAVGGN